MRCCNLRLLLGCRLDTANLASFHASLGFLNLAWRLCLRYLRTLYWFASKLRALFAFLILSDWLSDALFCCKRSHKLRLSRASFRILLAAWFFFLWGSRQSFLGSSFSLTLRRRLWLWTSRFSHNRFDLSWVIRRSFYRLFLGWWLFNGRLRGSHIIWRSNVGWGLWFLNWS